MPKRTWSVSQGTEQHTVTVQWSLWSNSGSKSLVAGQTADAWSRPLNLSQRRFTLMGKEAVIRWHGLISQGCELSVNRQSGARGLIQRAVKERAATG